jgi:nicotinate phosphoribosyltransferase
LDAQFESAISKVKIDVLKKDGQIANGVQKPVLKIKGPYKYFAILESIYLGILARATKVATNTKKVVETANSKPVWFFADRFDLYANQNMD